MYFPQFAMQAPMAIIKRTKLNGLGDHHGVMRPDGFVFHTTDDKGVHLTTLDDFAKGRPVEIIEHVPIHKYWESYGRMQEELIAKKDYNLFSNNCEIVANRVVGNSAQSKQVAFWMVAATLLGIAALTSNG